VSRVMILFGRNCLVAKIGRNQSCPCGSGRKYKHCCLLSHGGMQINMKTETGSDIDKHIIQKMIDEAHVERMNKIIEGKQNG